MNENEIIFNNCFEKLVEVGLVRIENDLIYFTPRCREIASIADKFIDLNKNACDSIMPMFDGKVSDPKTRVKMLLIVSYVLGMTEIDDYNMLNIGDLAVALEAIHNTGVHYGVGL